MNKYHKINSIFKRDEKTRKFTDEYARPEFEYLKNNIWEFTEKVDGTNIRISWDGKEKEIRGRTDKSIIPQPLLNKLNEMFPNKLLEEVFNQTGAEQSITLYGEGYGNKIQAVGKHYIKDDVSFILFDINASSWWLQRVDVDNIAKQLSIKSVPVVGYGTLGSAIALAKEGMKSKLGDLDSEGLIAVPRVGLLARNKNRIITKVKTKDFK